MFMPDVFSREDRSRVMSAIRSRGNLGTEIQLAKILRRHRIIGWRRHQKVFGHPDFVFPKLQLAIFVDGCFWHGCPKHGRQPRSNKGYWTPKLRRTKARDKRYTTELRRKGWHVIRIWQHELRNERKIIRKISANSNLANSDPTRPRSRFRKRALVGDASAR